MMTTAEFRKWIEAGLKDYGTDPWFFLRELAQNSRDAGAKIIRVKAGHTTENEEILTFEDDGHGMTYSHAVQYLFRLYASSKLREKYSAGKFGIGFWTVLKFNPTKIRIESKTRKEKWGVMVDAELNTTRFVPTQLEKGTRITLIRPAGNTPAAVFASRVEEALVLNCSYMRRNTRKSGPLPVLFKGKNITVPMKLPGPVSLAFKKRNVEGAVGLGPRPLVRLYARGLPVWHGTTLEELSHTPPARTPRYQREMAEGLAPVFLLNGSNLEVNISRRKVIDNHALQRLRKTAEKNLDKLVELAADSVSPRNFPRRVKDRIKKTAAVVFRSPWKSLLATLLLLLPLEFVLLNMFMKTPPAEMDKPPRVLSMKVEKNRYSGVSGADTGTLKTADISYSPPVPTWFKLYHAETYEAISGFTQSFTDSHPVSFPPVYCDEETVTVRLNTVETGTLLLPQPTGFFLEPAGITLDNRPLPFAEYRSFGGAMLTVPRGGVLQYQCCLPERKEAMPPESMERLTRLPQGFAIPVFLQKELDNTIHLDTDNKVERAVQLTASLLKYDDSAETSAKYTASDGSGSWFQRVLNAGAGDCDILNGVTVLLLRKMGIPARLVIGLVGDKGTVLPGMHAWTEYWNSEEGWRNVDTSAYTPVSTPSFGSGTVGSVPSDFLRLSDNVIKTSEPPEDTGISSTVKRGTGSGPLPDDPTVLSIVSILLLLFIFLLLIKIKPKERFFDNLELPQIEENLAGMALHALLHPNAWGNDSNIRNVDIIPTITGRPISLRRTLKLSNAGKLFYIGKTNPLADHLKKSSVPILQSGNPVFDPLIKILPEAVDLDRITGLKAVDPGTIENSSLGELLTAVNRLISPPCLAAPGLVKETFFDVDLSPLPHSYLRRMNIPARFIAVNPAAGLARTLTALFEKNPQLAQFKLIKALLRESILIPGPVDRVIERVSLKLSKEMS